MSQIKRQYLRLEDITEKTYLTQGDVWGRLKTMPCRFAL